MNENRHKVYKGKPERVCLLLTFVREQEAAHKTVTVCVKRSLGLEDHVHNMLKKYNGGTGRNDNFNELGGMLSQLQRIADGIKGADRFPWCNCNVCAGYARIRLERQQIG